MRISDLGGGRGGKNVSSLANSMCHLMGKCVCAFGGDCGVFDLQVFKKPLEEKG